MPRYKLTIEYDGAGFSGWQRQANGASIQQALEEALFALTGERMGVHGAGRTDAGVHASGQVAHVDIVKPWVGWRLREGVNAQLSSHRIAVLEAEAVVDDFDARHSALARRYLYRLINRRAPATFDRGLAWHMKHALDAAAMNEAAKALLGAHDFSTFRDSQCQANSPRRTLDLFNVERAGDEICFHVGSAIVPASTGAVDGGFAGRGRARQVARGGSSRGAGGGGPEPMRPRRARLRVVFGQSGVCGKVDSDGPAVLLPFLLATAVYPTSASPPLGHARPVHATLGWIASHSSPSSLLRVMRS